MKKNKLKIRNFKKCNFILCNFSVRTLQCFQKNLKVKKLASKVAHNQPRPFYSTFQPRPQHTAQNWFSILWNLGTRHLFSYLWVSLVHVNDGCKGCLQFWKFGCFTLILFQRALFSHGCKPQGVDCWAFDCSMYWYMLENSLPFGITVHTT